MEQTKEKLKFKKKSGITLIALVVTIVILIILATISISIILNDGFIDRTVSGKELHELEREKERLELVKTDVASNTNHIGKVTVDTYVEELMNQNITTPEEVTDNGDGSKTVITDTGYSVLIEPVGENDVKITIDGKAGKLPPRIRKVDLQIEIDTIKVTVEAIRAEKYSYEYKEEGIEKANWIDVIGEQDNVEIKGIDTTKDYIIRATAINEYGTAVKEVSSSKEEESVANAPRLSEGMTPVKWNGTNWEKTTQDDKEWYSYTKEDKKWANVVLGDSTFKTVDGVEILDESKTYSQLVWIPRYAYQIRSMYHQFKSDTEAGKMSIVFINSENVNTVTRTKYTRDSKEQYPSATIGGAMKDYVVHPAFDFGGKKLDGFWVGKYKSSHTESGKGLTLGYHNGIDKTMMIKANVSMWWGIDVGKIYSLCLSMNAEGNPYGLNTNDEEKVDPHLIKNDEWGAIAYLSRSKYGIEEEVYVNNQKEAITGIGGSSAKDNNPITQMDKTYHTEEGKKASTTGNVYGVYDMHSIYQEYTAAYIDKDDRDLKNYGLNLVEGKSKYKNIYKSITRDNTIDTREEDYAITIPSNGYYGDAIYETNNGILYSGEGSWYGNAKDFPSRGNLFFTRKDLFGFRSYSGYPGNSLGFRVTIPVI